MEARAFVDAVRSGQRNTVARALGAEAGLARARVDGATALHVAAIENHADIVDLLLAHGADLDAPDEEYGMAPIGWANERGHAVIVQRLAARGAAMDLHDAAAFGLDDTLRARLGTDGARVNERRGYGAPLHYASLWGRAGAVDLLLAHGADPALRNRYGLTAIEIARRQVDTDCRDTPILVVEAREAIRRGCGEIVQMLEGWGG